jgi:GNAT superfamily N-acetyltransferase
VLVRGVALSDVPAIYDVHEGSDGPWIDPFGCAIHVNHRLLRPFHCRVLERDGQVVGHAEWIVNREPDRAAPCLYLGMLQVRADSQGQGIGRRLVADGVAIARDEGCDALRTVPDSSAVGFYDRCGFAPTQIGRSFRLPVKDRPLTDWCRARLVPARASRELPMRLGWVQACSSHMWEICNQNCPNIACSWPAIRARWATGLTSALRAKPGIHRQKDDRLLCGPIESVQVYRVRAHTHLSEDLIPQILGTVAHLYQSCRLVP